MTEAYELVVAKACEQRGWRSKMVLVRVRSSPNFVWVLKEVAQDRYFEVVKV
jgi:hypothetical protein